MGVTLYNQGNIKKASGVLKRAHNEYREQGNIEQAEKIEQLMQQIAQKSGQQQPQVSQTATPDETPDNASNVVQTPEPQTLNQPETPANYGNLPVSVEPQSTSTSPGQ